MITAYLPDTIGGWVIQSGDFEPTRSLEAEVKGTTITACCINVFSSVGFSMTEAVVVVIGIRASGLC